MMSYADELSYLNREAAKDMEAEYRRNLQAVIERATTLHWEGAAADIETAVDMAIELEEVDIFDEAGREKAIDALEKFFS